MQSDGSGLSGLWLISCIQSRKTADDLALVTTFLQRHAVTSAVLPTALTPVIGSLACGSFAQFPAPSTCTLRPAPCTSPAPCIPAHPVDLRMDVRSCTIMHNALCLSVPYNTCAFVPCVPCVSCNALYVLIYTLWYACITYFVYTIDDMPSYNISLLTILYLENNIIYVSV
jgi:hypothetical protein